MNNCQNKHPSELEPRSMRPARGAVVKGDMSSFGRRSIVMWSQQGRDCCCYKTRSREISSQPLEFFPAYDVELKGHLSIFTSPS